MLTLRDRGAMVAPLTFLLTAAVADLDDTVPGEPEHPALVVVADGVFGLMRVIGPSPAWSRPRELLQVGRRIRVTGVAT